MNYNYHTHTYLCSHATGTMEEYIKRAIDGGIKYMGFSEHAPFAFPDGFESWYRLQLKDVETYFEEANRLRDKYKDLIDIKIGFELEYYPKYFEEMLKNAKNFGAEYVILGQHFINQSDEAHDGTYITAKMTGTDELKEYVSCVIKAIESGVFSYVAHPDIFNFAGDINSYNDEMSKICVASKEKNVPLEINFYGIRDKRRYPDNRFLELAGMIKCPMTFGFDSHDTESAFDGDSLKKAEMLVKEFGLNYIGKPEIKSL